MPPEASRWSRCSSTAAQRCQPPAFRRNNSPPVRPIAFQQAPHHPFRSGDPRLRAIADDGQVATAPLQHQLGRFQPKKRTGAGGQHIQVHLLHAEVGEEDQVLQPPAATCSCTSASGPRPWPARRVPPLHLTSIRSAACRWPRRGCRNCRSHGWYTSRVHCCRNTGHYLRPLHTLQVLYSFLIVVPPTWPGVVNGTVAHHFQRMPIPWHRGSSTCQFHGRGTGHRAMATTWAATHLAMPLAGSATVLVARAPGASFEHPPPPGTRMRLAVRLESTSAAAPGPRPCARPPL